MTWESSTDAYPPGFRFHPSEQQLLSYYLLNKKSTSFIPGGYNLIDELLDLPGREPSYIQNWPWYSYGYKGRKRHWYFYTRGVSEKEEGKSKQGYWKRKGKVRDVFNRQGVVLGTKTSFVYYDGSSDRTSRTDWVLYQYALANHVEGSFVIWRVFSRSDRDFNSCTDTDAGVITPGPEIEPASIQSNELAQVSQPRPAAIATPSFIPLYPSSWPAQGPCLSCASMPYYSDPMVRQGQQPMPTIHKLARGVYHLPPSGNMPESVTTVPCNVPSYTSVPASLDPHVELKPSSEPENLTIDDLSHFDVVQMATEMEEPTNLTTDDLSHFDVEQMATEIEEPTDFTIDVNLSHIDVEQIATRIEEPTDFTIDVEQMATRIEEQMDRRKKGKVSTIHVWASSSEYNE